MNGLAGAEVEALAGGLDLLALEAGEMHFDAVALAVEESVMLEAVEIEGATEFAIDAREQIEIERSGDAGLVVIGGVEDLGRLDQVDADDQRGAGAENLGRIAQE